jgi:hypothetical protein
MSQPTKVITIPGFDASGVQADDKVFLNIICMD